jgi:DNA-directed RNA polymerase subunit RPC12/RpoP
MPFEIVCGNCGETLYWGMDLIQPREVLKAKRGICHNCGARLSLDFVLEVIKREVYKPPIKSMSARSGAGELNR